VGLSSTVSSHEPYLLPLAAGDDEIPSSNPRPWKAPHLAVHSLLPVDGDQWNNLWLGPVMNLVSRK